MNWFSPSRPIGIEPPSAVITMPAPFLVSNQLGRAAAATIDMMGEDKLEFCVTVFERGFQPIILSVTNGLTPERVPWVSILKLGI